ncbi:MAG: hypothetical protein QM764_10115 [Chitinophagaceae bacterium]
MKKFVLSVSLLLLMFNSFCQTWTEAQLDSADTAKDIEDVSDVEKDAILYINLARLFPQQFEKYEVEDYSGPAKYGDYLKNSSYRKSLIKELKSRKPVKALHFNQGMYDYAKCFAKETGDAGAVTHKRKKCADGNFAECCSYGMETGRDIALQWLIDDKIADLGHRINCLNKDYTMIGVAWHSHKKYTYCAVADMQ